MPQPMRLLCPLALAATLASPVWAANPDDFQVYSYDNDNDGDADIHGRLYVPANYDPSKSYGWVTFYHGVGESVAESEPDGINVDQVKYNIDNLVAAAKSRGFFLYAPQAPSSWNNSTLDVTTNMVARGTQTWNIDTSRMYVTGLSMGGGGAWDVLSRYDDVYSAAAVICGAADGGLDRDVAAMVGEPIWAYHARNDNIVNVSATRSMVNRIRAADGNKPALAFPLNDNPSEPHYNTGSPYYSDGSTFYSDNGLRYSEYASGAHGIWNRAYGHSAMYDWMLGQSDAVNTLEAGETLLFDLGDTQVTAPDAQGRRWNSTLDNRSVALGPAVAFAETTDGRRTGVTLNVSDAFTGENTGLLVSGTDAPTEVANDGWSTGSFSGNTTAQGFAGALTLLGLDAGAAYTIELFASHNDNDNNRGRVTRYTIGGQSYDLDIVGNTSNTALFGSVLADAAGSITIDVRAAPGTASRFGFLSWFSVTAVPEPTTVALLVVGCGGFVGRRRSVS